jgi:hypothetical protein
MRGEKKSVARIVALFIGAGYWLVSYRIPYFADGGGWLSFYLPATLLLFPVMLWFTLYFDDTPVLDLAYFLLGLVIGVSVDVLLFHRKVHGIVWVFTSIGACVLLAPIAVSATALGWWISRRRANA